MVTTKMISVIHVVSDLHSSSGGPSRSIVQLADALAKKEDLLISIFSQKLRATKVINPGDEKVSSLVVNTSSILSHKFSIVAFYKLYKIFKKNKPSIVHSHGIWSLHNHWAVFLARRNNIPLIIHTRGMLMTDALKFKTVKKNIVMSLFQRKDIECADILIATSKAERDSLRDLGFLKPIAVIPNGIEIKNQRNTYQERVALRQDRQRTVLFLSRIHPIKGLLNLVKAWSKISTNGWKLRIVGPDTDGHLKDVVSLADELNISDTIEYLGEVFDEEKSRLYSDSDLFILPSFSENFGVVVLEALSYGIPVITTQNAPWSDLEKYNCGWWVEGTVDSLSRAIKDAILLGDAKRNIMSLRASEYVKIYSWNLIASNTSDLYFWSVNGGDKPNFLYTD